MNADINAGQVDEIVSRHPDIFKSNFLSRYTPLIAVCAVLLYGVYVWNFFSVGEVMRRANWQIAGSYLADWVAYEVKPDVQFHENYLEVEFSRFSPLGDDPQVPWITNTTEVVTKRTGVAPETAQSASEKTAASSLMAPASPVEKPAAMGFMVPGAATGGHEENNANRPREVTEAAITKSMVEIGDAIVTITPAQVDIARGVQLLSLMITTNESVTPLTSLPQWALQKREGGKVVVGLGFPGRVEIENDEVKIRHRFWGWENFLFDTRSPFWGRSLSEVAGLVAAGPDLEEGTPNWALAWDNVANNAEWQHGDVWLKLLQTIVMAFIGTLFAALLAFPLAFAAARNITRNVVVNQLLKRLFDFLRSVDMLIWALVFTRTFGPGPLAGISAIFFTDTGTFGKLYSESLENVDDKQREGVKSVGASPLLVQRYGVVPQVLPVLLSQWLYFWESNTRSATIIGAVGAGGIGLKLWEAMRTNQDWENVAYMVVLILIVVFVFDNLSNFLRSRLIGKTS